MEPIGRLEPNYFSLQSDTCMSLTVGLGTIVNFRRGSMEAISLYDLYKINILSFTMCILFAWNYQ